MRILKNAVALILIVFSLSACAGLGIKVYIFADISECQNIITYKAEDAKIEIYESPSEDKYLKGLQYKEFFACKYVAEDFEFRIFAYQFIDSDICKEYFKNFTGNNSDDNINFSGVKGITYYYRMVMYDDKAYTIYTSPKDSDKVENFIADMFSVEVYDDTDQR
ncbi:MAG: hypothetical protein IJP34_03680 [Clostridia bacterium]|nr:hypothetical protein [Clostridia bacterium]